MDNEKLSKEVGKKVRVLRNAKGWTLDQLCQRLDEVGHPMQASALAKRERGDRGVSVDDLAAFAVVFDIEVGTLLTPIALKGQGAAIEEFGHLARSTIDADKQATHYQELVESARRRWLEGMKDLESRARTLSEALGDRDRATALSYVRDRFGPDTEQLLATAMEGAKDGTGD